MTSAKTVASSVAWTLVRSWGARLAGFVIYFQLVRLLNPAEMGLYAAAFAAIAFLELFADQGLTISLVQRKEITNELVNAAFIFNIVSALALIAVIWWSAKPLETITEIEGLSDVLQVCSLSLAISSLGFCQDALARRAFLFKLLAMRSVTATIASGAVGVVMAWYGFGVWALVGQLISAAVINTFALWIKPAWKPGLSFDFRGTLSLARFGISVLGIRVAEYLNTRGIEFLYAILFGAASLGIYSVGGKLYFILSTLLGSAIIEVAYSVFSRVAAQQAQLQKAYVVAVSLTSTVALPCWLLLSSTASDVIAVAFGHRWMESSSVLQVLAFLGAVQMVQRYDASVLISLGKPRTFLWLSLCRTLVAMTLAFAFSKHGMMTSVWAYFVGQLIFTPLSLFLVKREVGLRVPSIAGLFMPQFASGLIMWAVVHIASSSLHIDSNFLRLVVLSVLGASCYLILLFVIDRTKLLHARQQLGFLRGSAAG